MVVSPALLFSFLGTNWSNETQEYMTVCETALIRIIDCAICVNKLGIMGNPLDPRPYPSRGCRRRWRENAQIFPLFSGAMCKQGRNYGEGHRSQAISESVVAVIIGGKTPRFSRCFRSWSHDKRVKKKFFLPPWLEIDSQPLGLRGWSFTGNIILDTLATLCGCALFPY